MSASAYECQCARVNIGEESLPEEFLQTGVTESVTTGGHLNRFPHRFAAQRTLEAPLRLLQKLVIEPRHGVGIYPMMVLLLPLRENLQCL